MIAPVLPIQAKNNNNIKEQTLGKRLSPSLRYYAICWRIYLRVTDCRILFSGRGIFCRCHRSPFPALPPRPCRTMESRNRRSHRKPSSCSHSSHPICPILRQSVKVASISFTYYDYVISTSFS